MVFSFDACDRPALDRTEGRGAGYNDAIVTVNDVEGRSLNVLTYLAHPEHIDDRLRSYGWDRTLVVEGACEHGLPQHYVADRIEALEAIEDPDLARDAKERALLKR